MKRVYFFALVFLKFQFSYSQSARAKYETHLAIDPSQTTYVVNESSIPSLPGITFNAFNECYNNDYVYGFKQIVNKQSFRLAKRQKQVVKPERYEFRVKMNAVIDVADIDLLFKHSFNTKSSLVILYIPIGKRS